MDRSKLLQLQLRPDMDVPPPDGAAAVAEAVAPAGGAGGGDAGAGAATTTTGGTGGWGGGAAAWTGACEGCGAGGCCVMPDPFPCCSAATQESMGSGLMPLPC